MSAATAEASAQTDHGDHGGGELLAHVAMIHELAERAGKPGKLVLARFGEDPETGRKTSPLVRHFAIGDVEGMAAAVRQLGAERDRNLYIPLSVLRPDLPKGQKGCERDVVAVLGLVPDFDDDQAADYEARLPLPPSYVLETSANRFQAFFLLDEAATVEEAKPIAEALKTLARCDHGTADLSHVWRVPGTLNWPTKKKLAKGRPREPQTVRVVEPWDGTLVSLAELRKTIELAREDGGEEQEAPHGPTGHANGHGPNGHDAGADDFTQFLMSLPEGLRRRIIEPTPEGERSENLHFVVCALMEKGLTLDRIEALIRANPLGVGAKYVGRSDLRREIERIQAKWQAKGGTAQTAPGATSPRDTIRVKAGELHIIVAAAAGVLGTETAARPFCGYYRRGNLLVHTVRLADETELRRGGIKRARGALAITPADPDGLRVRLTSAVGWKRYDRRSEEWLPTDAPPGVIKAVIATAVARPEIPILTGVVEAPALRPDGTVLDRPGYDPATGLLFDPGATEFPPVPASPTREHALAALALLRGFLNGFPFVGQASESVALSGLITPLVRKACRAVPLHAYTAPKMASGKTLLATLAGYVATGRAPAMMSQAEDPNEERKRMLAVLIEGQNIVIIDNVEREVKSDTLCTVLTEPSFSDRLLGVSKTVHVPSSATWYATGNNIQIAGDLTTRAIVCVLDPECERPEERTFSINLHEVVPQLRSELAAAALTIVRAYLAAGEPKQSIPNFARFEDWSRFVRQPLVWLGMADPCGNRHHVEGRDPVRAQLGALLTAWYGVFAGDAVTVATAIDEATRDVTRDQFGPVTEAAESIEARAALREALTEFAGGQRVGISGRLVGRFLSKHERRVERGLRFENVGTAKGGLVRWKVRAS